MEDSFKTILARFSEQQVLVIGDVILDEYIEGSVERISPEAPVPVVLEKNTRMLPGGAGNVVCNLRALLCTCRIIAMTGRDDGRKILNEHFIKLGLLEDDLGLIESRIKPTTRKTRILSGNHQMLRLDREDSSPITEIDEDEILGQAKKYMEGVGALIISDYDKGLITPRVIQEIVKMAHAKKCFIAVDPQVTHFDYYKNVDVLTPNHHEAGKFLGRRLETKKQIEEAGFEIIKRLNAKMLLITRGENGMSLFIKNNKEIYHVPTMAREVFDVTGAGDTVVSLFALSIAAGASPKQAVVISNKAAGLVVKHVGAATVSNVELLEELKK